MSWVGIIVKHTLSSTEVKRNFVNQTKGKIVHNLPMGQRKFSYELTLWFISIENGGKQKSKNTLTVG